MANLLGIIFVVFVIGFGVTACWAITANGAAHQTTTDSFGNTPPDQAVIQDNQSSNMATATMPILPVVFVIMVCVVIVSAAAWLWKTGGGKSSKSGY
jgi:hypothetical protein